MKKLLNKTLKTFTLYALIVLAASVPAYYYLVDSIWVSELDEHNRIIADRTGYELKNINIDDKELSGSIALWNKLRPGIHLEEIPAGQTRPDSVYTILKKNPYIPSEPIDRFRGLSRMVQVSEKAYLLTVETNVEETEETVLAIAALTFFFFLLLVAGFLLLTRQMSTRLWKPFRNTLSRLKTFDLNSHTRITFESSDTLEFEELNDTLDKLIDRNVSIYRSQKEFTENASHELQTPLAIIKNKLDLLLQKETLTDRQYQIIEDMNRALTRISRINKNLLLLTKIDNHQFDSSEPVNLSLLVPQSLEQLKEHSGHRQIHTLVEIEDDVIFQGNKTLIEILVNNLVMNAIRHNKQEGTLLIGLSKNGLTVSNSGERALNPDDLFRRFAKISGEMPGTGLGLAIIKEICNHYRWTITYTFENNLHIFSITF